LAKVNGLPRIGSRIGDCVEVDFWKGLIARAPMGNRPFHNDSPPFILGQALNVNLENIDVYAPPAPEVNAQPATDLSKRDMDRRAPLGEVPSFAASEALGVLDRQLKLRSEMPHCTPKKLQSKLANLAS
jgi:hypothetical protein